MSKFCDTLTYTMGLIRQIQEMGFIFFVALAVARCSSENNSSSNSSVEGGDCMGGASNTT